MTYQELKEWVDTLSPEQLRQTVSIYSGDIDETMPAIGVCFNTDEEMGEAMDTLDPGHPLLLI